MWQSYILTSTALVRHSNWANEWLCCVSPVSNQLWHAIGGTDPWPSQHVADTHIKYYPKIAIPAFGSSSTFHFWLKHIFWKIDIFQQVYRPETSATVDKTLSQWNGGLIYSCAFYHTVQSSCTDTTFGQAGVLVHICWLIMQHVCMHLVFSSLLCYCVRISLTLQRTDWLRPSGFCREAPSECQVDEIGGVFNETAVCDNFSPV